MNSSNEYKILKLKFDKLANAINNDLDKSELLTIINDNNSFQQDIIYKSDKLYKTLIKNYPNGTVIVFDKDMRYLIVDGKGLEEVGLNSEVLENKLIYDILEKSICDILEPAYKKCLDGDSSIIEFPFNNHIYSAVVVPIIEIDNKINYGMVLTQDITDKVMNDQILEKEVDIRTKELKRVNFELAKTVNQLNNFAYVASHDLQEPLRTISSFSQLLAKKYKDSLDETGKEYINTVLNSAKRMHHLIDDLLLYSKVSKSKNELDNLDLNYIIETVIENNHSNIEKNNVKIIYGQMPVIKAEKNLMIQLFQNIISNAIKYCTQENPLIKVDCIRKNDFWEFSIRDNGIGIEEKFFEKIFVAFQRLHNHTSYKGTGIGLATSKKIVELYNGEIWVESELGQGSVFYFTLPAQEI